MRTIAILALACATLAGCATVRQQDLDAWRGMPVAALDTHSFFITVPLIRRVTDDGLEIRNYRNGGSSGPSCFSQTFATGTKRNPSSFTTSNCFENEVVCNNLFFIRDGTVLEYAPKGRCMTNSSLQPEAGWGKYAR